MKFKLKATNLLMIYDNKMLVAYDKQEFLLKWDRSKGTYDVYAWTDGELEENAFANLTKMTIDECLKDGWYFKESENEIQNNNQEYT